MTLPYLTPLDAAALRALGIPAPWAFGLANRVRFHELDALGHVNNTASLSWFEDFRLTYLARMEVTTYGPGSPRLVLAEVGCRYREEMLIRQDYVVTGRTRSLKTSSFTMDYAAFILEDGTARLAVEGHAVIVLRTPDGKGRFPIPEAGRARLVAEGAEAL